MIETHDPTSNPAPGPGDKPEKREKGFTLIVALLVMGLLTVLGLSLIFSAETERTMSRNFAGTIQATYAAEAVTEAMTRALLFDLEHDSVGGWANQYLVICEYSDEDLCDTNYGFKPTDATCYDTTPADSCVVQDTDGTLTGVVGQWAANLAYRTTGTTTFPSQLPVRLHTGLKEVLPWWLKFDIDSSDADRLNTGTAEIALTSVCTSACTTATPTYSQDEIFVTGIGKSVKVVGGRLTQLKNPATRALSVRIQGTLHKIWKNALVGGSGGDDPDKVIAGNYVIRGGVLIFNQFPAKDVLEFNVAGTGIVNNYYAPSDSTNPIAPIDSWWWLDAKGCGQGRCDSTNTVLADSAADNTTYPFPTDKPAQVLDNDATAGTATVEPIGHRLPHPPDLNDLSATNDYPGGYKSTDTTNFPGPEGLEAEIRINRGKIVIGDANARLGTVTGTDEPGPPGPGHYWRNVLEIFTNDEFDISGTTATATIFRNKASTYDLHTRSGTFNLDTGVKFPALTEPYLEPITKETYQSYQDFLRPEDSSAHPGGWGLDLSGIDGTTGVGRDFSTLDGTQTTWPNETSPSVAELNAAFGTSAAPRQLFNNILLPAAQRCTSTWYWDSGTTTCGTALVGPTSCTIGLIRSAAGGTNCPRDTTTLAALTSISYTVYRRSATTAAPYTGIASADATASQLNFDTSSSIDSPKGRAQSTMYNSFAYKLYVDTLAAVDSSPCTATTSTLYQNNFGSDFPAEFEDPIPASYRNPASNQCITWESGSFEQYKPCFAERYAYMDVHIQLSDVPDLQTSGAPAAAVGAPSTFRPEGRWLSVRMRPPGLGDPITVLNDPRARRNPVATSYAGGCNSRLTTDLEMELQENVVNGAHTRLVADLSGTAVGVRWKDLNVPARYDRAIPMNASDITFRNMPTGAFVIAMHLPCSEDETDKNPYKCTTVTPTPSIAYPGFYTHLIAWFPKYTCARTSSATIAGVGNRTTMGEAPPHIPDPTPSCGSAECPANARPISWWAQSLWQANMTTLWNIDPPLYPGTPDAGKGGLDLNRASQTGFALAVPFSIGDQTGPCGTGIDRRDASGGTTCSAPPTTNPLQRLTCNTAFDGVACNSSDSECYSTGCGNAENSGGETDCYDTLDNDGDGKTDILDRDCSCGTEPDFIPYVRNPPTLPVAVGFTPKTFGGCTEIFTPLVTRHNSGLNPELEPFVRSFQSARNTFNVASVGLGFAAHWQTKRWCSPGTECSTTLFGQGLGQCMFRGIDPDLLSGWVNASAYPGSYDGLYARYVPDRWDRDWPGWPSVSYLYGAGQVFTRDGVRFGSPNRTCENAASCPSGEPINSTAADCYNCGLPNDYDTTLTWRKGFFSDPIVYDGRLILYSGEIDHSGPSPVAAAGKGLHSTTLWFHDHVVPRAQMGCSDFLSVLTTGDTEIDIQKSFVASPARHLLAAYTLTGGELRVTTAAPNLAVQHELAGSWIAEAADFGTYTNPVQIIGTPSLANSCDHVYLPGRDPYATGELISYVEDTTLPFGY